MSGFSGTLPVVPNGLLFGLTLSAAGSSITFGIAAGVAVDSTNAGFMVLSSAYTKQSTAWAVGSATGSLDTGSIAVSTWYHVFLIKRLDTGVVDVLTSLSATAPTMPTNYTLFRRIGSMKTDGASGWTKFSQFGDEFLWAANVGDVNSTTQSTTAVLNTLTVPTGVKVLAMFGAEMYAGGGDGVLYLSSPDQNDEAAPAGTNVAGPLTMVAYAGSAVAVGTGGQHRIRTNTSAQIRSRANSALTRFIIQTYGWIDTRGKDS